MGKLQEKESKSLRSPLIQKKGKGGTVTQRVSKTPLMRIRYKRQKAIFGNSILQKKSNNTGLPDNLKSGIESLSGHSMDDVNVHYNSSKPAQLNAHAFAQGTDIHLASGAEQHLPHEAWHVVQQKQGRVQPTRQMKGKIDINDNEGLEREADVMGERAVASQEKVDKPRYKRVVSKNRILQRAIKANKQRKRNKNSITDTIALEGSKSITGKYAKVNFGITGTLSTQFTLFKSEVNADASVEAGGDGITIERSIVLHEAKTEGKRKAQKIINNSIDRGGYAVDKIEAILQDEDKEGTLSSAVGVKLLFHNKQEMTIKFNAFSINKDGIIPMKGLTIEHVFPFPTVKLWERDGMSLTGTGNVKIAGGVEPNWSAIMHKLAPYLNRGKNILRSFLSTLTIEGLIAAGFIMGGVVSIFSLYAAMDDINDIDNCEKSAISALSDFTTGYCRAFGINSVSSGGSIKAFSQGKHMAQSDLGKIIQMIQKHPLFSPFNFTMEELAPGIIDRIQRYPEKLYSVVKEHNKEKIYKAYILAFYEKKKAKSWGLTETSKGDSAYREAKVLADMLGMSRSFLPKPSWQKGAK